MKRKYTKTGKVKSKVRIPGPRPGCAHKSKKVEHKCDACNLLPGPRCKYCER